MGLTTKDVIQLIKRYAGAASNAVASHSRRHALTSIADHSSTATPGYLMKSDSNGLPIASTVTEADVATSSHARQHAITSTADHTSSATPGQILKADANGLPVDGTNTDAQVAAAVTASHARSHSLTSTSDHTSSATASTLLKADANGLPVNSNITDDGSTVKAASVVQIGTDIAGGNYFEHESTGFAKMAGSGMPWKSKSLAIGTLMNNMDTATVGNINYRNWSGTSGDNQACYGTISIPEDYKEGTSIIPWLTWFPSNKDAGNARILADFEWQNIGENYPTVVQEAILQASPVSSLRPMMRMIWSALSGTGRKVNSELHFRLYRGPAHEDDTYNGRMMALSFGFFYQADTLGGRSKGAKT